MIFTHTYLPSPLLFLSKQSKPPNTCAPPKKEVKRQGGKKEKKILRKRGWKVVSRSMDMTHKSDANVLRTACYSCAPSRSVGY